MKIFQNIFIFFTLCSVTISYCSEPTEQKETNDPYKIANYFNRLTKEQQDEVNKIYDPDEKMKKIFEYLTPRQWFWDISYDFSNDPGVITSKKAGKRAKNY